MNDIIKRKRWLTLLRVGKNNIISTSQTYVSKHFIKLKSYTQTLRLVFALVARLQSAPCETSRHDYLQSDEFHFARRAAAGGGEVT